MTHSTIRSLVVVTVSLGAGTVSLAACDGGPFVDVDAIAISACDPSAGPFSTTIDNPYFPLAVGSVRTYESVDALRTVEVRVLEATELVAGVATRVVEERVLEDGEVVEVSRNFYAETPGGTVCNFGEDVDIFEPGGAVRHDGQWRVGGDNHAGVIMPAAPIAGTTYPRELAPGVAEDRATFVALGEEVTVPAGTFGDTVRAEESTPLEPGVTSTKVYARGIGLLIDGPLQLSRTQ